MGMVDVWARTEMATRTGRSRPGAGALYGGVVPKPSAPAAAPTPCDLVGLYTARAAERLCGLRGVIHEHRAASPLTLGVPGPRPAGSAEVYFGEVLQIGRGTGEHRAAAWRVKTARRDAPRPVVAPRPRSVPGLDAISQPASWPEPRPLRQGSGRRKVAAAVFAALIVIVGAAGTSMAQGRYQVREGDTLTSVAATFGVDAAAIAAASYLPDGPALTPGQVVVIPDPGQGPADAAAMAARLEGTSPWVAGAHEIQPGDTLVGIAAAWGVDAMALAAFNGIPDPENLLIGERVLIPQTPQGYLGQAPTNTANGAGIGPGAPGLVPASDGVFIPGVGGYVQSRNLSCEYAAAFIATSAFGAGVPGVPEWVFIEQVPAALNPHYGYRGNIDGWWGNTVDYGVYPEALAPVLEANGFGASIFYSAGDTEELIWHLDEGRPVLTWLGLWGDTSQTLTDEGTYTVAAGAHVVVVYGYDAAGVYASDPADGVQKFYAWDDFRVKWAVLDGMAMAVAPA